MTSILSSDAYFISCQTWLDAKTKIECKMSFEGKILDSESEVIWIHS